jgi:hypothetical protein
MMIASVFVKQMLAFVKCSVLTTPILKWMTINMARNHSNIIEESYKTWD